MNSARDTVYAISDSGLVILPVGSLNGAHRLAASREDIVFRGSFCDRQAGLQDVIVSDPGGGVTDFTISTTTPGISISPASGTTPVTVHVAVDAIFCRPAGHRHRLHRSRP